MITSESSMPNEWNVNPSDIACSPTEYGNALKAWVESAAPRRPAAAKLGGGQLLDRATRLLMASRVRSSRLIREL